MVGAARGWSASTKSSRWSSVGCGRGRGCRRRGRRPRLDSLQREGEKDAEKLPIGGDLLAVDLGDGASSATPAAMAEARVERGTKMSEAGGGMDRAGRRGAGGPPCPPGSRPSVGQGGMGMATAWRQCHGHGGHSEERRKEKNVKKSPVSFT